MSCRPQKSIAAGRIRSRSRFRPGMDSVSSRRQGPYRRSLREVTRLLTTASASEFFASPIRSRPRASRTLWVGSISILEIAAAEPIGEPGTVGEEPRAMPGVADPDVVLSSDMVGSSESLSSRSS